MRIAVLGTGVVGATLGSRLVETGHEVRMGSRTARNDRALAWVAPVGDGASEGTFADAAAWDEVIINATGGLVSVEALTAAGADNLTGKTVLDVSNPLDFSEGFPPKVSQPDGRSLGEHIQEVFPEEIIDVGGISAARGLELYLPLWLSLIGSLGSPSFNVSVVRA